MEDIIRIQMMGNFNIFVNERIADNLLSKTRKGVSLMQVLIMNRGKSVSVQQLLSMLWDEEKSSNPENALKTLISRLRVTLSQLSPTLGQCIVADRGAYHWQMHEGMSVDLYEIDDLLSQLYTEKHLSNAMYERLLALYKGDLPINALDNSWAAARATELHDRYMSAIYTYIETLKLAKQNERIVEVCRLALEVDDFDDRLHMELMTALINTNRNADALSQYRHVMHLNYRYLGVQPSEEMQEFYKRIVHAGKSLEFNLESIRNELRESDERRGAFLCEYVVFKEIYNLQMRNLERTGSTMFLAVIMVSPLDGKELEPMKQDNIMQSLVEILKVNLRKGDTITQISPTVYALLLPTVNYTTGNMVMERIKRLFYRKYPSSDIQFDYRVGPLSSEDSAVLGKNTKPAEK